MSNLRTLLVLNEQRVKQNLFSQNSKQPGEKKVTIIRLIKTIGIK